MKLNTKHFGEIDVEENNILDFEDGLPGFPDDRQFVLLENEDPFCWLQSVTDGDNAFILVDAFKVLPDYNPQVDKDELESLGTYEPSDFLVLNIVVLPDDVKDMTVNLLAPVIINTAGKKGRQVVLKNEEYGVRHYMFRQRREPAAEAVGPGGSSC